jgi:hypothetical protein
MVEIDAYRIVMPTLLDGLPREPAVDRDVAFRELRH